MIFPLDGVRKINLSFSLVFVSRALFFRAGLLNHRMENTVEYYLFPALNVPEDKVSDCLENVKVDCFKFLNQLSRDYIWHQDQVNLRAVAGMETIPAHLYGKTEYGANVDDEWYLVHLLQKLSEAFPDIIIRVIDEDGEFPLIEAAENLPKWANPESCENRVYIYRGKFHIIPVAQRPSDLTPLPSGKPTIMEAVHVIRAMPHITVAPEPIQQPIQQRIDTTLSDLATSLHRANLFVPAAVAALLKSYPALVSPAVHAFCQRDPSQLKVVRAMRYFPPETRVWTRVTFTKCLYAMLSQRTFVPDKKTGWNLPPAGDAQRSGVELGMKLAVGFELLANEEAKQQSPLDLENEPRWHRFVESLKGKGYFQNYIENSKPYCELLEKAREFYISGVSQEDSIKQPVLLRLLDSIAVDTEQLKREEKNLPPSDDDSWLNIDPDTLDAMLEARFGNLKTEEDNPEVVSQLQGFLERMSDFEGAELNSQRRTSRKLSHLAPPSRKVSALSDASDASHLSGKIGFDPDSFSSAMKGILDFAIPDDNWDLESDSEASGMSSYSDEETDEAEVGPSKSKSAAKMEKYMAAMEEELLGSNARQTIMDRKESVLSDGGDSFSDVENFRPVNVDASALESLLASYTAQHGGPGPTSTLLGQLGIPMRKLANSKTEETEKH